MLNITPDYTLEKLCCDPHKVCNEYGKLFGQPLNRALRDDSGKIYDIIAGTFFIVGLDIDDFESISDPMLEKYAKLYRCPEKFIKFNGEIHTIPYNPTTSE